jgi:branched-chain amino acid transport system ATP-binding protein/sulfate-transporting ATPase
MSRTVLAVQGLTVRFGGLTALDRLDLRLEAGEVLGLIGPNGSGKTTFFNAVTGLYRPAAGQVRVDDRDITGATPQQVCAAGIARTFQRSRLCLPLSVFDNLMVGNHRHLQLGMWTNLVRRSSLRRQYEQNVGAARELLATFSAPLAQRLFEPVSALPMIDRRRVEICRALIGRPRILLLDEPSAGMTHDETEALMDDLELARGGLPELSVILIEHEMGLIERVTERCAVLNYGEKVCEGPYREVAADERVRKAYLGED